MIGPDAILVKKQEYIWSSLVNPLISFHVAGLQEDFKKYNDTLKI